MGGPVIRRTSYNRMKLFSSLSHDNRCRLFECLEILLYINDEDVTQCVIDLDELNSSLVARNKEINREDAFVANLMKAEKYHRKIRADSTDEEWCQYYFVDGGCEHEEAMERYYDSRS